MFDFVKKVAEIDLQEKILSFWKNINPVYKKSFFYIFIILNIVFAYHTINFMWGNHDWTYIASKIKINTFYFMGRFTILYMQQILFGGRFFPILNNLVFFAGLAVSAILMAKYFKVPKTVFNYTCIGLFWGTMPFTLSWLYYIHMSIPCAWLICFAVLAIFCAENIGRYRIFFDFLSVIFFFYIFAAYMPILNTIFILLCGKILLTRLNGVFSVKDIILKYKNIFIDMGIALVIYKFVLICMTKTGAFVPSSYNSRIISCDMIAAKFIYTVKVMCKQFFVSLPFMEGTFHILLFVVVAIAFISMLWLNYENCRKNNLSFFYFINNLVIYVSMLFATKLSVFLADANIDYAIRIDFFGLAIFYLFSLVLFMSMENITGKNLALIAFMVVLPLNCINVNNALKVWKLGFDAEQKMIERIISRIENCSNFDTDKKYILIAIGEPPALRLKYYHKTIHDEAGNAALDILLFAYSPDWYYVNSPYGFYYPCDSIHASINLEYMKQLDKRFLDAPGLMEFVFNKAKPWPAKNSIYITGNYIYLCFTQDGIDKLKLYLKEG